MDGYKNDIGELIKLKYDFELALDNNDLDKAKDLFEKFRSLYTKITGKEFDDNFTIDISTQNPTNIVSMQEGKNIDDLEIDMDF